MESARKREEKRKIHDPKAWGLQLAKAASPPTLLAPCTTKDPVDPKCRRLQRIRERLRTESLPWRERKRLQDIEEELSAELDM